MDENAGRSHRRGKAPLVVALVCGVGLILAPVAFRMFSRAPEGGVMIDAFEPYMTKAEIAQFRGYLAEIDAADQQSSDGLKPALTDAGAVKDYDTELSGVAALHEKWPGIKSDMNDLLDRMEANIGNYEAVAALPPLPFVPLVLRHPGRAHHGYGRLGSRVPVASGR